jgi:pimeloyl-ACP methyl ester carboxylesterase
MGGSIDAFHRMSKAKEPTSLADKLNECAMPVRLLVGTVSHPSEVTADQRAQLGSALRNFSIDSVAGSGQYIQEEQPAAVLAAVARLNEAVAQAAR